ncbi:hypothetical protein EUA93_00575 [Nocardioides oleivorans]|uniref:Uncharacterized protein n=1 Tax=Nocardioides oleivorans TaxID=273676 RepID=A0A4Q2RV94_9ACTN|nr:hypothetical protein [Nocardioides oleivorans]RYB92977.1 hypothetical protein EUA93_00575 [Nocardioides oleivorans]
MPRHVLVMRALLFVLPVGALALALPEVPHWFVVGGVLVAAAQWARSPDHVAGAVALVLVACWWAAHGVVDWRVLAVGVLLVAAHVVSTVLALGPSSLPVDRHVARLWGGRALLVLVPLPVTWLAVRGLDPALAPSWVWLAAGVLTVAMLVTTSRLTQSRPG